MSIQMKNSFEFTPPLHSSDRGTEMAVACSVLLRVRLPGETTRQIWSFSNENQLEWLARCISASGTPEVVGDRSICRTDGCTRGLDLRSAKNICIGNIDSRPAAGCSHGLRARSYFAKPAGAV